MAISLTMCAVPMSVYEGARHGGACEVPAAFLQPARCSRR